MIKLDMISLDLETSHYEVAFSLINGKPFYCVLDPKKKNKDKTLKVVYKHTSLQVVVAWIKGMENKI